MNNFCRELRDAHHCYVKVDGHNVSCFVLADGTILVVDTWGFAVYEDGGALEDDRPTLERRQ